MAEQVDGRQSRPNPETEVDDPRDFPPQEDGFQRLWTPQRMSYVLSNDKQTPPKSDECPFCIAPTKSDQDGLIVWRGTHVFVIMNLYPYNAGHVMVCPYRHISLLTDLSDDELFEFEKASTVAMKVMSVVSKPDGWNLGINQGDVAGAGKHRTCTSTSFLDGTATRTSCPSSPRRARCRFCFQIRETPMRRCSPRLPSEKA